MVVKEKITCVLGRLMESTLELEDDTLLNKLQTHVDEIVSDDLENAGKFYEFFQVI